jgi:DNA mismatch repair protein MutL
MAGTADPAELLRELASQELPGAEPLERIRHLAATIACKAAVKAGFPLGHERMRYLVDELFACDVPTTCPHGRVAILRLSDRDIDHRFQRI